VYEEKVGGGFNEGWTGQQKKSKPGSFSKHIPRKHLAPEEL